MPGYYYTTMEPSTTNNTMPGYYVLHYNGAEVLIIIQCQDTTTLQWSWSTNNNTMSGYYYITMELKH